MGQACFSHLRPQVCIFITEHAAPLFKAPRLFLASFRKQEVDPMTSRRNPQGSKPEVLGRGGMSHHVTGRLPRGEHGGGGGSQSAECVPPGPLPSG